MTTLNRIAEEVRTRLQQVTVANGYATNAGQRVFRGRPPLDQEDIPCIVITEMFAPVVEQTKTHAKMAPKLILQGHVRVTNPDSPNADAHDVIGDMIRAVLTTPEIPGVPADRKPAVLTLGGAGPAPRDPGMPSVAGEVEITLEFVLDKTNP